MEAHLSTDKAHTLLEDAADLLSLIGAYPHYLMSWVQPDDWLKPTGMTTAWQFFPSAHFFREREVKKSDAEPLAANYFSLDPQKRNRVLSNTSQPIR
jgi:hypothetical protein